MISWAGRDQIFDSGQPVPGYTGFKAPAQGDFCRLVVGDGLDPKDHSALDINVEINRRCPAILRLLQRQRGFGRGNLVANPPHNGVRLALEGGKFGIRARMKVAVRRTSPPRPAPLVAAPVQFRLRPRFAGRTRFGQGFAGQVSNIIVRFSGGVPSPPAILRPNSWATRLRLAALVFATALPDRPPRHARHRRGDQRGGVGRGEGGFVHAGNYTAAFAKGDRFARGWCNALRRRSKTMVTGVG
jgi:hypothetical protein